MLSNHFGGAGMCIGLARQGAQLVQEQEQNQGRAQEQEQERIVCRTMSCRKSTCSRREVGSSSIALVSLETTSHPERPLWTRTPFESDRSRLVIGSSAVGLCG